VKLRIHTSSPRGKSAQSRFRPRGAAVWIDAALAAGVDPATRAAALQGGMADAREIAPLRRFRPVWIALALLLALALLACLAAISQIDIADVMQRLGLATAR
jgi:hypothetical protein